MLPSLAPRAWVPHPQEALGSAGRPRATLGRPLRGSQPSACAGASRAAPPVGVLVGVSVPVGGAEDVVIGATLVRIGRVRLQAILAGRERGVRAKKAPLAPVALVRSVVLYDLPAGPLIPLAA